MKANRRLTERVAAAGLSPSVARAFAEGLKEVAAAKGGVTGDELALIGRFFEGMWEPDTRPAPFESIWPHGELFLTACIYVAVADGHYDVEEARAVSAYAHRLGFSAHQLAELEARVFAELHRRGAESVG